MKKTFKALLAFTMVFALVLTGCGSKTEEATGSDTLTGTYTANVTGYDWGCGVDKITITFDNVVDAVSAETFTVVENKEATDWTDPEFKAKPTEFPRTVTAAYTSDAQGNKTEGASTYVTLELYCSPSEGSPFNYSMADGNVWCDPYELHVAVAEGQTLTSGGTAVTTLEVNPVMTSKTTSADPFQVASFTATDGTTMNYGYYTKEGSDALFVWLHGGGEGARTERTDVPVAVLANKVTALLGDEFQNTTGGMSVLAPHCPDYWMHTKTTEDYTQADKDSIYTEALHELIASYAQECGASKIVISGCSNGGYMTVVLACTYGQEYTAYVPICEGVQDQFITEEDIATLKELPMFFIYSEDDDTLAPAVYSIPTIARLQAAGAAKLAVSTSEHVIDTSGQYTNEDGTPYMYSGHWSWIYFDNNEALENTTGQPVWEWIADQLK